MYYFGGERGEHLLYQRASCQHPVLQKLTRYTKDAIQSALGTINNHLYSRSEESRKGRRHSASFPDLSPVTEPISHKLESRMRDITISDIDRQRVEDVKLMGRSPPLGLPVLEPIAIPQEGFSAKERKVGCIDNDAANGAQGAGPPSEQAI